MSRSWYILHTYTGYENKIERTVRTLIESGELDGSVILDIKVPVEKVKEIRNEKEVTRTNKFLPGYVLIEMDLPEIGWKNVCAGLKKIQGVTGFVGTNANVRPIPISEEEVKNILSRTGDIAVDKQHTVKHSFNIGDRVKINDGPFSTFEGIIKEIVADKEKLLVEVQIFGRPTPVEVGFLQVAKL